ncbi:MAG: radical SAM family heme chaperone HemW [Bacteroidales bacterium]|nr:radical SAM family heme chaperone HemW [Bacteroidales bacterium]
MIYVHIPFCRSFCTYCDFYSEVAAKCRGAEDVLKQEAMFGKFADALVLEMRHRADEISNEVNTLYIGGGTPSVLPLCVFERILQILKDVGHGGPYDEFTVEVNPEDIVEKGEEYVKGLLELGVNRISMGVQSFDDGILKFMNRRHDAQTARRAYAILENAGVMNISIDLIFGLSQLTDSQWKESLNEALSISPSGRLPQHISSYQLSVEPGSMLARLVKRGKWEEASDELCERQYAMLCDALRSAGYSHYEISNFALPGYEARHNSAYWRHVPYIGLGPGAHSLISPQSDTRPGRASDEAGLYKRRWNEPDLNKYVEDPLSVQDGEELTEEQVVLERIMLALRTSEGISEDYLKAHVDPQELERAFAVGNLTRTEDGRVRIPEKCFFISDSIITDII